MFLMSASTAAQRAAKVRASQAKFVRRNPNAVAHAKIRQS